MCKHNKNQNRSIATYILCVKVLKIFYMNSKEMCKKSTVYEQYIARVTTSLCRNVNEWN